MPAPAMSMPMTQMKSERPTEPERLTISAGVAKIPVPTMRLKMRNTAEMKETWRRESEVTYCSPTAVGICQRSVDGVGGD